MTFKKLIIRTLKHYPGSVFATAAGVAIATAVICGALIIGDSLKASLLQIVDLRLGQTTHSVTAGERLFTQQLGHRLHESQHIDAATVLKSDAIVTVQGSNLRVNKVQVWGVDSLFPGVTGAPTQLAEIHEGESIINRQLADRLDVSVGDFILIRVNHTGIIPVNTPLVSEEGQSVTRRVRIQHIAEKKSLADFNLQSSQSAPYNLFVNLGWLNRIMGLDGMANMVLIRDKEGMSPDNLQNLVKEAWSYEDGNLSVHFSEELQKWMVTSERVFFDSYLSDKLESTFSDAGRYFTWMVNGIVRDDRETPYSFVTAFDDNYAGYMPLSPRQTMVNQWLADDLDLSVGDTIILRYYTVGAMRELTQTEENFSVVDIIPMARSAYDQVLMPDIPGLSDAGSCSEWEAGIPVDLDAIRQKDEQYWDDFRGTPKAYISLEQGRNMWSNRFGNMTTLTLTGDEYSLDQIKTAISRSVDPFSLEFQLNHVREAGLNAARGGVDFTQLFAGLGMFIIIAGLLLMVLLLSFSIQKREKQIKLFAALGYSQSNINKILLTEAFFVTVLGAIAGLVISIGYSHLIFKGLNQIWYDIVRTETLSLHYRGVTLLIGMTVSILLGLVIAWFTIRKLVRKYTSVQPSLVKKVNDRKRKFPFWLLKISCLLLLGFAGTLLLFFSTTSLLMWFITGTLLLFCLLAAAHHILHRDEKARQSRMNFQSLSRKNLKRNPARSMIIIIMLALGSFVIVLTAINRKDSGTEVYDLQSGTGGFHYMAETTVPILRNLRSDESKRHFGLPGEADILHFLSTYDDDASCLNLNRVENPRILAVNPEYLNGRFSFVASTGYLDRDHPWLSLNQNLEDVVPAIADQSVIQWGLGKSVGDTLTYVNAHGERVKLLLIGGLTNSIFQGNVIISEEQFLRHFPTREGSHFFLIELNNIEESQLAEDIQFQLRDYGWDMVSTADKLSEYNSVENTYLAIFFLMGALGMLLGTFGLAIIIAKSLLERKSEIALLTAIGFHFRSIVKVITAEYLLLFIYGLISGALAAIVATAPTILEGGSNMAFGNLALVFSLIVINGVFWIIVLSYAMIKKIVVSEGIRND